VRKTKDGPQARWLLSLAAIYDGATRTEAARIGGVMLQIIWDWVMRFNDDAQRHAIVALVRSLPRRVKIVIGDVDLYSVAAEFNF
jgi:hypothetical protein